MLVLSHYWLITVSNFTGFILETQAVVSLGTRTNKGAYVSIGAPRVNDNIAYPSKGLYVSKPNPPKR